MEAEERAVERLRLIDGVVYKLDKDIDDLCDMFRKIKNEYEDARPGEAPEIDKGLLLGSLYTAKRVVLEIEELIKLLALNE